MSGGGGAGRRPGPGGEEVEQKNPANASWSPGMYVISSYQIRKQQSDTLLVQLIEISELRSTH